MKANSLNIIVWIFTVSSVVFAQKGLVYDPEKGIVFDGQSRTENQSKLNNSIDEVPSKIADPKNNIVSRSSNSADLHVGRKKDPPEVYFQSGLEYFKNKDFENAYKNFNYADSTTNLPIYKLWKVKALRRMGRVVEMLNLLGIIIRDFSSSDVADDALLEMAIYFQSENEYEKALQAYTQVIEQYPFGVSASNGEELPALAREQRKLIRAEMLNLLSILGIKKSDLPSGYKQFQKENNLPITGAGTKETVSLIKKMHLEVVQDEQRMLEKEEQLLKYQKLIYVAIALVGVTLTILFILRVKISNRKRQIFELNKALIELDLRKL